MATSYACDGCGTKLEVPVKVGYVVKREYCADCAPKAQAFLNAEEVLRTMCHRQFLAARMQLIEHQPPGFKLPDVP